MRRKSYLRRSDFLRALIRGKNSIWLAQRVKVCLSPFSLKQRGLNFLWSWCVVYWPTHFCSSERGLGITSAVATLLLERGPNLSIYTMLWPQRKGLIWQFAQFAADLQEFFFWFRHTCFFWASSFEKIIAKEPFWLIFSSQSVMNFLVVLRINRSSLFALNVLISGGERDSSSLTDNSKVKLYWEELFSIISEEEPLYHTPHSYVMT